MSDGNASSGKEALPFRRRDSEDGSPATEQLASAMSSPEADLEGNSSPRRSRIAILSDDGSMASNRAQHSTSFSVSNARAGSGELPDDYVLDAMSDQIVVSAPSNYLQGFRQPRKTQRLRSSTTRSRPTSQPAADKWTGKASSGGSESRLRYSINSTDELGDNEGGPSRLQQQILRSSPLLNDERSTPSTNARQDNLGSLSKAVGGSIESSSYGQESAGRMSNAPKFVRVDRGTASYGIILEWLETKPPTEEQLLNDIRATYAGIVVLEQKLAEYRQWQYDSETEWPSQKWQRVVAIHRTMLHEHHDFYMATQHPLGNPALKRLAEKHAMPARLWRHGIHAFLELLRFRLPASLEYMLTFIYAAYSMMTLLLETAPSFEETWIECLGDLSRYRMAIEEADFRERDIWAGIARYWYNKAADRNPDVGRIQHHLAVLARPDIVQQLFYYTKSLVCVRSFVGTRESIFLLFNPLLKAPKTARRLPEIVTAFVAAHGYLFTNDLEDPFMGTCDDFLSFLEQYIGRMGPAFKMQGVYIASCNFAAMLEYGAPNALLTAEFLTTTAQPTSVDNVSSACEHHWTPVGDLKTIEVGLLASRGSDTISPLVFYGSCLTFQALSVMLDQIGNKNIFPSFYTSLAFLWCLAQTPSSMKHGEALVPWKQVITFLNTLFRNFTDFTLIEGVEFPGLDEERWLPEDFLIRGQIWSQNFFPANFFIDAPTADEGRNIEPPSRDLMRMHRCLWLGVRLATFNRWMTYDATSRKFSATDFASQLDELAQRHNPCYGKGLQKKSVTDKSGADVDMHDT